MPISRVHLIDNLLFMAQMPDFAFDLAPSDPNYGIKEARKNHESRNTPKVQANGNILRAPRTKYVKSGWDDAPPPDEYFKQLFRISRNQIIWGANYFKQLGEPFKTPRRNQWEQFIADHPTGWIIWDKVRSGDFNDCELAWTSFDRPTYILQYIWNGMMQGKSMAEPTVMQGNKRLNEKRIHPTQKPLPLNRKLLIDYAQPGDKIFDSHMGSQSLRIAAMIEGLDYEGCELDPDIFDSGNKRYNNECIKLSLFNQ